MKLLKTFEARLSDGSIKKIEFGQPTGAAELSSMYKFRHDSYLRHGYISAGYFHDGLDRDVYDSTGRCVYFVAKVDKKIIGSVRLIVSDPLPTEKDCFDFVEPATIEAMPRDQRAEVSRLIVEKLDSDVYFPRHLVMLGLISCLVDYAESHELLGGYGFIKDKLKNKLAKIKIPIGIITQFQQKYSKGLLHDYFNDPQDPVWPIYYSSRLLRDYLNLVYEYFFVALGDNFYRYEEGNWLRKISFYFKLSRLKRL
ncbi:MAG: hypothetical protein WC516_04185 [Patescibacteria group bacterium]